MQKRSAITALAALIIVGAVVTVPVIRHGRAKTVLPAVVSEQTGPVRATDQQIMEYCDQMLPGFHVDPNMVATSKDLMEYGTNKFTEITVVNGTTQMLQTSRLEMIQTGFPFLTRQQALTILAMERESGKRTDFLMPVYERYRHGDPKAIAELMAYARNETNDMWARATAVQAIEKLRTKEALMFGCSFLYRADQLGASARAGLPLPLEQQLSPYLRPRSEMTSQEFSNLPTVIEREIDRYLAASTNPPATNVNQQ